MTDKETLQTLMNQDGELYIGKQRDPADIKLEFEQYEALQKLTQGERKCLYPLLMGASKRKRAERKARKQR